MPFSPAEPAMDAPLRAVRVHRNDSVAIAMTHLPFGATVSIDDVHITTLDDIPAGHKVALHHVAQGDMVKRYGFPFGRAVEAISPGAHVHTQNVVTTLGLGDDYSYAGPPQTSEAVQPSRSFLGYHRPDGSVGIRNEIWILPTVGCVGRTAERLATMASSLLPEGVDGVHAFPHPFGCSQLGSDLDATSAILAALASNPNAGGVLLLGLGCESNQLAQLLARIPADRQARVRSVGAQASEDEMEDGLAAIAELAALAALDRRAPAPLSALRLGVKCGGSDGLSGLTANPLIGRIADTVGDAGGSIVLTEIPEMFGAEQMLIDRCINRQTADALIALVRSFKSYFADHNEPVSENPSPGNIRGGITTLEEKSLGAVQKGGHVPVTDVIGYAQILSHRGLTILEAPGNDAVSTTALAAAGVTLTLFSTGRGTPLGSPVPVVKIASNSGLANAKRQWIDFDAGQVLEEGLETTSDQLLDHILSVASGAQTCSERNDERGLAIWKRGVTL